MNLVKYGNMSSQATSCVCILCRRCRHPHIVQLLATFEAERGVPGFILQPHLAQARKHLFGFKVLLRTPHGRSVHLERFRHFLQQVRASPALLLVRIRAETPSVCVLIVYMHL